MSEQAKKQVSVEEFEKKVEIEVSHLTYIDRLPKEVAMKKARADMASRFEVVDK